MSSPLIQYESGILETWGTGRLFCLYTDSFIISRKYKSEKSQTERIACILSRRSYKELEEAYEHINSRLKVAKKDESSKEFRTINAMNQDFIENVLERAKNFKRLKGYELISLAKGSRERLYIHSFLEHRVSQSVESGVNLVLAAKMIVDGECVCRNRHGLYDDAKNLLEKRVEEENYEECVIIRDLINSYVIDVNIKFVDRESILRDI